MLELGSFVFAVVVVAAALALGVALVVGLLQVVFKIVLFPLAILGGALKVLFLLVFLPLIVLCIVPGLLAAAVVLVPCLLICWALIAIF